MVAGMARDEDVGSGHASSQVAVPVVDINESTPLRARRPQADGQGQREGAERRGGEGSSGDGGDRAGAGSGGSADDRHGGGHHAREMRRTQGNVPTAFNSRLQSPKPEFHRMFVELIGTTILTFVHAGLSLLHRRYGPTVFTQSGIAWASGTTLVFLIYSLGHISGAHFNPAITYAFTARGLFPWRRVPLYWAMQYAGGFLAALLLMAFFGTQQNLGANHPEHGFTNVEAFFWETILSYMLVFVVLHVTERGMLVGPNAALAVGALIAQDVYLGALYGGGSMNPARSLGPAVLGGEASVVWIYELAPFLGATLALATNYVTGTRVTTEALKAAGGEGENVEGK